MQICMQFSFLDKNKIISKFVIILFERKYFSAETDFYFSHCAIHSYWNLNRSLSHAIEEIRLRLHIYIYLSS